MFSRLYACALAEMERQLQAERARANAAEAALAFERGQREQATARLIEMGRQAIQCKEEATQLRVVHVTLENNMRFQLGERVAKDMDQSYQNKVRELEEIVRRFGVNRPLTKQDEQDLKDLILSSMEEFRLIVRRAL